MTQNDKTNSNSSENKEPREEQPKFVYDENKGKRSRSGGTYRGSSSRGTGNSYSSNRSSSENGASRGSYRSEEAPRFRRPTEDGARNTEGPRTFSRGPRESSSSSSRGFSSERRESSPRGYSSSQRGYNSNSGPREGASRGSYGAYRSEEAPRTPRYSENNSNPTSNSTGNTGERRESSSSRGYSSERRESSSRGYNSSPRGYSSSPREHTSDRRESSSRSYSSERGSYGSYRSEEAPQTRSYSDNAGTPNVNRENNFTDNANSGESRERPSYGRERREFSGGSTGRAPFRKKFFSRPGSDEGRSDGQESPNRGYGNSFMQKRRFLSEEPRGPRSEDPQTLQNKKIILDRYTKWGYPQDENVRTKDSFRVNFNAKKPREIVESLKTQRVEVEKVPFLNYGYDYRAKFPLSSSVPYLLGEIYVQEASAQIPGELVAKEIESKKMDKSTIKILDMCAAPGGKATQFSEILENKGEIIALENDEYRLSRMLSTLERMRTRNVIVKNKDARNIEYKNYFDFVILDAPCSGNYEKETNWFSKRTLGDFKNRKEAQIEMLKKAYDALKNEGVLVYSTCSLEMEENEEVVEYGVEKLKLKVIPIDLGFGGKGLTPKTKDTLRIWPTQHNYPGFYVALLQKETGEKKAPTEKIVLGDFK